jgi:hypothetical protein
MKFKIILAIFLIGFITNIFSIRLNENDFISNDIKVKRATRR